MENELIAKFISLLETIHSEHVCQWEKPEFHRAFDLAEQVQVLLAKDPLSETCLVDAFRRRYPTSILDSDSVKDSYLLLLERVVSSAFLSPRTLQLVLSECVGRGLISKALVHGRSPLVRLMETRADWSGFSALLAEAFLTSQPALASGEPPSVEMSRIKRMSNASLIRNRWLEADNADRQLIQGKIKGHVLGEPSILVSFPQHYVQEVSLCSLGNNRVAAPPYP